MKVIDQPDQVLKLQEFIQNAQNAALSRGLDMQPAVAAMSKETARLKEERRRVEEELSAVVKSKKEYESKLKTVDEFLAVDRSHYAAVCSFRIRESRKESRNGVEEADANSEQV